MDVQVEHFKFEHGTSSLDISSPRVNWWYLVIVMMPFLKKFSNGWNEAADSGSSILEGMFVI